MALCMKSRHGKMMCLIFVYFWISAILYRKLGFFITVLSEV